SRCCFHFATSSRRKRSRALTEPITLMPVNVMHIRRVRMRMFETTVLMPMRVRLAYWIFRLMLMLVMLVMNVRVHVRHHVVDVLMLMTFRDVEPNAYPHEGASRKERRCDVLSEHSDGDDGPQKRRG